MPHPASSPSPPPAAAAATDDDTPLIVQAHASANSIFQAHVQTVLKHSSSVGLRHILKSRVYAHLKNELSRSNDNNEVCVEQGEKDPYQVTQDDINKCYCFAKRVGTKWANQLKCQGCVELSDIVLHFVNKGHFLEPNSVMQQLQGNNDETVNDNDNGDNNKFSTSNTALLSLRRYEQDCDGSSGKPLKYLRPITQDNNESSATKIVQQIDAMAKNGETAWHHGWDAIDEAVRRNRERIVYYSGGNQDEDKKEGGIAIQPNSSRKRVHFEDGNSEEKQTDEDDGGGVLSKKRRSNESDAEYDKNSFKLSATSLDLGRQPSSIGDALMSWESICQSMSLQERRDLIVTSIHPPYPFEDTETDVGLSGDNQAISATEDEPCVNIVGALKEVGLTHLFEQTRHLPKAETNNSVEEDSSNGLETFLGASATRASFRSHQLNRTKTKATRKAEKERFGRRAPVMGEKNANYNSSGMASKVKWTTEVQSPCLSNNPRESPNGELLNLQIADEPEQQRWLECDLGECILEEVKEDDLCSAKKTKQKRILAFRSLELAIRD
jgi:hypothetical protein